MGTRTTTDAFDKLHQNLKLDPNERQRAQELHHAMTGLLITLGIIVDAFLQGSFARKTMIAPLRDVDKVVLVAERLRGASPEEVMNEIQVGLGSTYTGVVFERTGHSLKVDFGAESFDFDIVPGWETVTEDDDVFIANRETGSWDRSNTRTLMRVVSKRNGECGGRFIHEVRMVKHAIRRLLDGAIPGLHVESWAYSEVTTSMPHDEAVAQILAAGARLLGQPYYDPTGVDLLSAKLKPDVMARAKPVLQKAAANAAEARRLSVEGRHEAAIAIWHNIFGDVFPAPSGSDVSALRASFLGTGITAAGRVSPVGTQRTQPMRPWGSG